jgi:hypothetical protein
MYFWRGPEVSYWLRHYATSRKVAGLRPDEVNEFLSSIYLIFPAALRPVSFPRKVAKFPLEKVGKLPSDRSQYSSEHVSPIYLFIFVQRRFQELILHGVNWKEYIRKRPWPTLWLLL